jgi:UDP-N-acetylglucosamine 2-epimerase (non-hydrolysing)
MAMIRVLTVFGTRPEAIKLAPVIAALRARPDEFTADICVTAQHRHLLDQVLAAFDLAADNDLDLMTPGQSPGDVVGRVLARLPDVLRATRPTLLLVQGDTMTTFAAALAAYLERVPVGHVEAGLRSGDRYHPFPEEMNRALTARLADLHFAPTAGAAAHLRAEGIPEAAIHVTGNTAVDAVRSALRPDYRFRHPVLAGLDPRRRVVCVTTHRRESFGAPLEATCRAVRELAGRFPDVQFVLPVHPNPQVKHTVETHLDGLAGVHLVEPLDYVEFVHLLARSFFVVTDSGGVQEEAPALGVPVLVLREETERPEGVNAGAAILVGTDVGRIVGAATELLEGGARHARMAAAGNPYGDGHAGERIAAAIAARFAPQLEEIVCSR